MPPVVSRNEIAVPVPVNLSVELPAVYVPPVRFQMIVPLPVRTMVEVVGVMVPPESVQFDAVTVYPAVTNVPEVIEMLEVFVHASARVSVPPP